eukprot:scpid18021/ scgid2503/ 
MQSPWRQQRSRVLAKVTLLHSARSSSSRMGDTPRQAGHAEVLQGGEKEVVPRHGEVAHRHEEEVVPHHEEVPRGSSAMHYRICMAHKPAQVSQPAAITEHSTSSSPGHHPGVRAGALGGDRAHTEDVVVTSPMTAHRMHDTTRRSPGHPGTSPPHRPPAAPLLTHRPEVEERIGPAPHQDITSRVKVLATQVLALLPPPLMLLLLLHGLHSPRGRGGGSGHRPLIPPLMLPVLLHRDLDPGNPPSHWQLTLDRNPRAEPPVCGADQELNPRYAV